MNIIMLLWWSLRRGNRVVPSRWQATSVTKLSTETYIADACNFSSQLLPGRKRLGRHPKLQYLRATRTKCASAPSEYFVVRE
jgi:hypothetical protein